jgi:hypothetical protein
MKLMTALLFILSSSLTLAAPMGVHFVKPQNNEVVPQTFPVEFMVDGMSVTKAGNMTKGTGHHHIIIDGKPVAKGQVVPTNATHKHFGDASTSTTLTLTPGKHTLTLQFADGTHKSYGDEYSKTITVEVK